MLAFLFEFKKIRGHHLIVVPKSTVSNWMNEFKKWTPFLRVVNLIPTKEHRDEILKNQMQPDQFDVCVTTYEGVNIVISQLKKYHWSYLIFDEAHKLKNSESIISANSRLIQSRCRLLLTGTPLQNNLQELWSLLNFLMPEVFDSVDDFSQWFDFSNGTSTQN
jgi:SWI/SNF-related matrix-associated actin-dependent regulator of chromatin subfamily A member 5